MQKHRHLYWTGCATRLVAKPEVDWLVNLLIDIISFTRERSFRRNLERVAVG